MNELANELINEIMLLGEAGKKPAAKKRALKPGESSEHPGYYHRGAGYYSNVSKDGPVTHKTDDTGKMVALSPEEKAAKNKGMQQPKEPERIGSRTGQYMGQDKVQQQAPAATNTTPKMGKGFKNQEIYNEFNSVMASGNPDQIRAFIEKYGVIFTPEKNTFYITLDGNGNKIEGDARKIFGDGKAKGAGQAQKALYDKLTSMGVEVKTVETSSVFAPSRVAPQSSRTNFGKVATRNSDGSITVTDSTGRSTTYEAIADIERWTEDKFNEWSNSPEGQKASEEEKRKTKEQLVVTGFAISERNRALRELLDGDEPVAMYDTPERQEEFVGNLESTIAGSISDGPRKERIAAKFEQYRKAKSPEEAAKVLSEIFSELEVEAETNKELKKSGAIPAIAEGFTAMVEMKRGRMVVVPLRGNFTASDVVSLATEETKELGAGELVSKVKLIYVGISVKFGKGGASSMIEKARLSVFRDHKQTRVILDLLATKSSQQGSIFDPDEGKRTARRQEVRATIEPHVQEVSDYYGFNPPAENVDQLIEWLGRGEPECVNGQVVPRRNSPPPVGKGRKSEAGKDPSGEAVDVEGWAYTWAAQGAYAAIYNSRVLGQAFASQTWKPGLVEVDGITGFTKQVPQPLKQAKEGSRGITYQPDTLVTFNQPVSSEKELRSGNPCK
jgi:SOS response regulatory protein OraA/RecX